MDKALALVFGAPKECVLGSVLGLLCALVASLKDLSKIVVKAEALLFAVGIRPKMIRAYPVVAADVLSAIDIGSVGIPEGVVDVQRLQRRAVTLYDVDHLR